MTGTGRNHHTARTLEEANERLRLVTNELQHAELELDHALRELRDQRRYIAALRRIADSESGGWGQIAHDALHPPRSPPPAT